MTENVPPCTCRDEASACGACLATGSSGDKRVQTLRPALALAVKRLREVYPSYEDYHEGGEIMRVIEIGERALAETAGPTA
jgi:hypothetical protein